MRSCAIDTLSPLGGPQPISSQHNTWTLGAEERQSEAEQNKDLQVFSSSWMHDHPTPLLLLHCRLPFASNPFLGLEPMSRRACNESSAITEVCDGGAVDNESGLEDWHSAQGGGG
jgi:hypothetical protein